MIPFVKKALAFALLSLGMALFFSSATTAASKSMEVTHLSVTTDKSGKIYLKWKKASRATHYKVYYSTKEKGHYKRATESQFVKGRSCTLKAGKRKTLYFKVRAFRGKKKGKMSNPVSCIAGSPKKNASKIRYKRYYRTMYIGSKGRFVAKADKGKVRYYSEKPSIASIGKVSGQLIPKKAGKVKIYAVAHNGLRTYVTVKVKETDSKRINGVPEAPVLNYLTARPQNISDQKIEIRLNFNTVSGRKYQVLRKVSGSYKVLGTYTAHSSSLTVRDKDARYGTRYVYTAREVEKNGTYKVYGEYDPEGITVLSPVKQVSFDQQNIYGYLKWDSVPGAEQYSVHRKIGKTGSYRKLGVTTQNKYDDFYYKTCTTKAEKEFICYTTCVDPSVNPFVYQIRAEKKTTDSSGHEKYSYSYYYKDGSFTLVQPPIIGYEDGVLSYGKIYRSDGYIIYKGRKTNDGILWTEIARTKNQSGTKQHVEVPYDAGNPYFTVQAYSMRNGKYIYSDRDEGFYIDYSLHEKYKDKKILYLGDSITYGSPYKHPNTRHVFSYPYRVHQLLGIDYFNPSIPGATNSYGKARFSIGYDVAKQVKEKGITGNSEDLGIAPETYPGNDIPAYSAYDIVILAGGTNDYGWAVPYIDDVDNPDIDNRNFGNMTGAINNMMDYIEEGSQYRIDHGKAPIKVIFVDYFYSDRSVDITYERKNRFTTKNSLGFTLTDYQDQYNRIIDHYEEKYASGEAKGLLQLYHFYTTDYSFVTPETCPYNMSDNLHMTRSVYGTVGNAMAEFIKEKVLKPEN